MRVRLYEVGFKTMGVLHLDNFPATLTADDEGEIGTQFPSGQPLCRLDDCGGMLLFEDLTNKPEPNVNDSSLKSGPLFPGDRLSLAGHEYMVSYEVVAQVDVPEPEYRILQD